MQMQSETSPVANMRHTNHGHCRGIHDQPTFYQDIQTKKLHDDVNCLIFLESIVRGVPLCRWMASSKTLRYPHDYGHLQLWHRPWWEHRNFNRQVICIYLVGGIPTPLKNMSSSVEMMILPNNYIERKRFQTTMYTYIYTVTTFKYTKWYFILPPGPRGLARPPDI